MATLMPFMWVIVMVLFLGGSFLWRQRMMGALGKAEEKDAHARVGNVAQRMGLTVVAGDPSFNFYHTGRWQDLGQAMSRNVLSKPSRPDIEVRMQGTPGGRRVEVVYVDRVRVADHLLEREVSRWLDLRLVVEVKAPFPEFEVVTRNPQAHIAPIPQLAVPPVSFGDPMLDQQLVLKTNDPRIAAPIAEGMRILSSNWYVHVIGQNGTLTYRFVEMAAMALGDGEKLLLGLDAVARGIEQAAAQYVGAPAR